MSTYTINPREIRKTIGFKFTKDQAYILENLKRFNLILGGKRVGKSSLMAYYALCGLLNSEENIYIVTPIYSLSLRIYDQISNWITQHYPEFFTLNRSELSIRCDKTRSLLVCKSAESPKSLKGTAFSTLIVDEAGDITEDIWHEYLRPNLAQKLPNGEMPKAILIGNATVTGSFFHKMLNQDSKEDTFVYHLPTCDENDKGEIVSTRNPFVPVEELKKIKEDSSERVWRQQYLAKFVSGQGTVFRDILSCAVGDLKAPVENHEYVIGIDLAKQIDWTVLTCLDLYDNSVVAFDRFQKYDWNLQRAKITAMALKYNNALLRVDANSIGDPIIEELRREGLRVEDFKFTSKSKPELIENLVRVIEGERIKFPPIKELVSELESFSFHTSPSGNVIYASPSGLHDDCVMSLALAVWGLEKSQEQLAQENPQLYHDPVYGFCPCHNREEFSGRLYSTTYN